MRHATWRHAGRALTIGSAILLGHALLAQESGSQLKAADCGALQGFVIPASAIGLPTGGAVVQSATAVSASDKDNPNGDFCKVIGIVKPQNAKSSNLEFEVNLPLAWNRRALQIGGGGYDGTLVTGLTPFTLQPATVDNALKRGFVTLGSDGGHKASGPGFDGRFALDEEALINYGKQSVKKAHDAAMAVIKKAYGRAPERFYFIGGSQGGHEALDAAARYPEDYDGVVAHYPAYNVTMLHLGSLNVGKAVYADGGKAWLSPAKTKLITDAVYARCDDLDGIKDGIIGHVKACNTAFDVKTLRCADGTDTGEKCLSDAQLGAVATINSDYKPGFAVAGMDTFPKWALLEGALFQVSNFGKAPQPTNPISGGEALLYTAGDQTAKFIITRDPNLDTMKFDPMQWKDRIAAAAAIMDVTNVSLEKFRARGGKIIMTHGTADDFITPHNSELYYQRQVKQLGQAKVDGFLKFYMIPGFGHGFGPFNAKFDSLTTLQEWVEKGKTPAAVTAIDGNPNAKRSRPLCEWPKWPKFTGKPGSENEASSFTCTAP
jgi:feruloyl esterase